MKKTTKPAAKAASNATPATPAPSPVKRNQTAAPKPLAPKTTATSSPSVNHDVAAAAPAIKPTAAIPLTTTIVAQIDVGFGNTLFIRGDGPGLSWEKGVPLDCVADDKWSISIAETSKPIVFKFLLNDLTWCVGDDFIAQPGTTVTVSPVF